MDALDRLRSSLSFEDQHLLVLRVDHGLSFRDIAATLEEAENVDEATARKRFERAKGRLARLAKADGLLKYLPGRPPGGGAWCALAAGPGDGLSHVGPGWYLSVP